MVKRNHFGLAWQGKSSLRKMCFLSKDKGGLFLTLNLLRPCIQLFFEFWISQLQSLRRKQKPSSLFKGPYTNQHNATIVNNFSSEKNVELLKEGLIWFRQFEFCYEKNQETDSKNGTGGMITSSEIRVRDLRRGIFYTRSERQRVSWDACLFYVGILQLFHLLIKWDTH